MLPSVNPLVTAVPLFCLWKASDAALAATLLLLYSWIAWLKVADPLKVALAFTNRVLALLAPTVVLPKAPKALPAVMLTGALKEAGAVKFDAAWTRTSWLLVVPSVTFVVAVRGAVTERSTGALNVDAAFTVSA